jgi:hypothetical protein
LAHEQIPLVVIRRQLGHAHLGVTRCIYRESTARRSSTPSMLADRRRSRPPPVCAVALSLSPQPGNRYGPAIQKRVRGNRGCADDGLPRTVAAPPSAWSLSTPRRRLPPGLTARRTRNGQPHRAASSRPLQAARRRIQGRERAWQDSLTAMQARGRRPNPTLRGRRALDNECARQLQRANTWTMAALTSRACHGGRADAGTIALVIGMPLGR